jgi:alkanesulfonate monooxygenase SsuD/methylene tetrahydromethanopterin reductase-like flavin-dependent oxidoreductase (luciferase family)
MEFGIHLPLLAFRGQMFSLSSLLDYAEKAEQLGFTTLCANNHLTFSLPWLDSVLALASVLTDDRRGAEEILGGLLSPILDRPVELLRERLLIGTPGECAEKLLRLKAAGVRKIFLWPVEDEVGQLASFHDQVLPQFKP